MSSHPDKSAAAGAIEPTEGRLPLLLVVLTIVTGIVDAVSFLRLGHVFVANMTGNVVFLGFAVAGGPGIDPFASIVAVLAFLCGARVGTLNIARAGASRTRMVALVATTKAVLLFWAVALAAILPISDGAPARYLLAAVLALTMGAQNAVARKLAIPDLTTTVLTMTLTALGSGGPGTRRRIAAIAAMFFGALVGAVLVLHVNVAAALAASLVSCVAIVSWQSVTASRTA